MIRNYLEKKARREQESDEETARAVADFTEMVADRREAKRAALLFLGLNAAVWAIDVVFPNFTAEAFGKVAALSNKALVVGLGFPFGFAMYATYSLLSLRIADVTENHQLDSDLMGSFSYQQSSSKRWFVWLGAITAGVLNVVLLVVVNMWLTGD